MQEMLYISITRVCLWLGSDIFSSTGCFR